MHKKVQFAGEKPTIKEIPREYVDIDPSSAVYAVRRVVFDPLPIRHVAKGTSYAKGSGNIPRSVDLKLQEEFGYRAIVVARQRAIDLARGDGVLWKGDDVTWEGSPKTHPKDDRRTPLLWIEGEVGRKVMDASDRRWWESPYFMDEITTEDARKKATANKYTHYGELPDFLVRRTETEVKPIKIRNRKPLNKNGSSSSSDSTPLAAVAKIWKVATKNATRFQILTGQDMIHGAPKWTRVFKRTTYDLVGKGVIGEHRVSTKKQA